MRHILLEGQFRVVPAVACLLLICSCSLYRPQGPSASETFDLRSKCEQMAHDLQTAELADIRSNGNIPMLTFIAHYNAGSNRCYLDESGYVGFAAATTVRLRKVLDAQDRSVVISCQQERHNSEGYGAVSCKSLGAEVKEQKAENEMNVLIEQTLEWPFSK